MSQLTDLIDQVSFADEISRATEIKGAIEKTMNTHFNGFNFASDNIQDQDLDQEQNRSEDFARPTFVAVNPNNAPIEDEEPYDAEKNASSLVYMITALDSLVLTIGVNVKCRANAGGNKAIKKMKQVLTKEISGQELTDHDKLLKAKFQEYKTHMELLSKEVIPSDAEIERLIKAAVPYCEETQIKIGAGFAFWTSYGGALIARASKLLQ